MRVAFLCFFIFMTACGMPTEISETISDGSGDGKDIPVVEDAVFIREVVTNHKGTKVQCRLNPLLVDLEEIFPVFIEFDGVEIERSVFKNEKAPVNFSFYNPSIAGNLICVVEFADAEFESSPLYIEPQ